MASNKVKVIHENGPMGWVMFTAWVGALVFFINQANGFGEVVLAILKSCVWPAYIVYYGLQGLLG